MLRKRRDKSPGRLHLTGLRKEKVVAAATDTTQTVQQVTPSHCGLLHNAQLKWRGVW